MERTILVSGSRPYNLEVLDIAIDKLKDRNLNIIFNLANKKDLKDYKQKYKSETHLTTYLKYCPDLLNTEKWEDGIEESIGYRSTLAKQINNMFDKYMPQEPSGLIGPVRLRWKKQEE